VLRHGGEEGDERKRPEREAKLEPMHDDLNVDRKVKGTGKKRSVFVRM
jgi:hypothetical protein